MKDFWRNSSEKTQNQKVWLSHSFIHSFNTEVLTCAKINKYKTEFFKVKEGKVGELLKPPMDHWRVGRITLINNEEQKNGKDDDIRGDSEQQDSNIKN